MYLAIDFSITLIWLNVQKFLDSFGATHVVDLIHDSYAWKNNILCRMLESSVPSFATAPHSKMQLRVNLKFMLPLDSLRVTKVGRIPEMINAAYVHLAGVERKTTVNLICDLTM